MDRNVSKTILVVEDDLSVRDFVHQVLRSEGYSIRQASCGRQGLEEFLHHRDEVVLILSDVAMPNMTGPQMMTEILRIAPAVRWIFMTGYSAEAKLPDEFDQPILLLRKPFTPSALLAKVRQCLGES